MRKGATLLILLFLCVTNVYAKIEDGIVFRSYNYLSEERTSLCVPAGQNSWINFTDSLSVSFSVKFDLQLGHFGYVCRMLADNNSPIDIVLSPKGSKTFVCATGNHSNAVCVFDDDHDLDQWREVYVKAFRDNDSIVYTANGQEVLRLPNGHRRHRFKMVFGKVDIPGFVTSDVAPMRLADLQIRKDDGKVASWLLSDPKDLTLKRGISIEAENALFARDLNSHWTKILSVEVPSVTYSCFSRDYSKVFFVSQGQILIYDLPSTSWQRITYGADIRNNYILDQFEVLPDGTLVVADASLGEFIRFNAEKGEWDGESTRTRISTYLHGNSVFAGGKFYRMFGYGQHRYSHSAWIWDPETFGLEEHELEGAAPRYLAGAGENDGKIYVLGGKGNESGQQELGVYLYDTLLEIDPKDFSSRTLWSNPLLDGLTPASDLVFLPDGIYTLLYNPEAHDSALQLTRFNPETGEEEFLSDPVPYPFLDITSQARLAYSSEVDYFVSAICFQDAAGIFRAEIYVLANPVIPCTESKQSVVPWWVYLLFAVLAAGIAGAVIFIRKRSAARKLADDLDIPAVPSQPERPGVYLLGGFHVRDKEGRDIASSFSPTQMQLLSILVLYTSDKGGVSNAKLKSILWPDKSDTSFNNNKGVYLKKLRDALEQVGPISIVQEGGIWKIEEGANLCDYIVAKQRIEKGDSAEVLRVASWGALLPEYQFDWLDPFKAAYANTVIDFLSSMASSGVSPEVSLRIADSRLLFDSLDEEAVALKCQALVALGRSGTAKSVFQRFTSDYLNVMGEDFQEDFSSFLKK